MRLWIFFLFVVNFAAYAAETTVYETLDNNGVPVFTNTPPKNDKVVKTINIDTSQLAPAESTESLENQQLQQENQQINTEAQAFAQKAAAAKAAVDDAQSSVEQAEENLQQAQQAMDNGSYRVGNDQYVDQDYIAELEKLLAEAKDQLTAAQENYNNLMKQGMP